MNARMEDVTGPDKGGVAVKTVACDVAHEGHEDVDKAQRFLASNSIHRQDLAACNAAIYNKQHCHRYVPPSSDDVVLIWNFHATYCCARKQQLHFGREVCCLNGSYCG